MATGFVPSGLEGQGETNRKRRRLLQNLRCLTTSTLILGFQKQKSQQQKKHKMGRVCDICDIWSIGVLFSSDDYRNHNTRKTSSK